MTKRLHEDHENAQYLANRLTEIPGIKVDTSQLHINLVFFQMTNMKRSPEEIEQIFKENKIITFAPEEDGMMRFATHYWIAKNDIDKVIDVMKTI